MTTSSTVTGKVPVDLLALWHISHAVLVVSSGWQWMLTFPGMNGQLSHQSFKKGGFSRSIRSNHSYSGAFRDLKG